MADRIATIAKIASIAPFALALAGCPQLEKVDDDPMAAGIPTEVQRAFDESCALAACHDSASRQEGLDLSPTGSASIIGAMSAQSTLPLVDIGNVQGSYLAIKMLPNPPSGVQMPVGQPPNADNPTNVAIILGWIAGAPNLPGGGGGGGSGTTTDDPAEESSGGSTAKLCGLDDVAPGVSNPFDIGMAAGQIPPDVGEALTNNCGCHEVAPDQLVMGGFPYVGMVHFSTIAEIQAEYMIGTSDTPRTGAARMLERITSEQPNRMPPPYACDLGDGHVITDADRELLAEWLMAGAPDAPNWMP